MPKCKNDPNSNYSGKEPSPKGLGWCAHGDSLGKKRKGNDGEIWIVAKRSNSTLYWKKTEYSLKKKSESHLFKIPKEKLQKFKADSKNKSNSPLANFLTFPKENWKKWEKQLIGLHQFRELEFLLHQNNIPLRIFISPVIWKNKDAFNSIPYRDALFAEFPQLKTQPSLVIYIDLDERGNAKTRESYSHYFNFTPEIENALYDLIEKHEKSKTKYFLIFGSIIHKFHGGIMKTSSTFLKPEAIEKLEKKYPFTSIRKDPYFLVSFFGKLPLIELSGEDIFMYMYDKNNK